MSERLPRLRPDELDPEQRELYERIVAGPRGRATLCDEEGGLHGPFNAMLLSPTLGEAVQQVGAAIRFRIELAPRVRELAILLVGTHCGSEYERYAHERIARKTGIEEEHLAAIRSGEPLDLTDPDERAATNFVRALLAAGDRGDIGDTAYATALDELGRATVYELATLVGYYRLLALQLRLFDVRPPAS